MSMSMRKEEILKLISAEFLDRKIRVRLEANKKPSEYLESLEKIETDYKIIKSAINLYFSN